MNVSSEIGSEMNDVSLRKGKADDMTWDKLHNEGIALRRRGLSEAFHFAVQDGLTPASALMKLSVSTPYE